MDDIPASAQGFIAAANASEASGDAGDRIFSATAALAAWSSELHPVPSATPTTAAEANARLEHLQKDAGWRDRYFKGDAAAVKEFDGLNKMIANADPTALAIAGVAPVEDVDQNSGAVATGRDQVAFAADLRSRGLADVALREIFDGQLVADNGTTPLSAEETALRVDAALRWVSQATRDPKIRQAILSGDSEANDFLLRCNATILLGRKGGAP